MFLWTCHVSVQQLLSGAAAESGTKGVPPNCLHQFNKFQHPELKLGILVRVEVLHPNHFKNLVHTCFFSEKHVGLLQSMACMIF